MKTLKPILSLLVASCPVYLINISCSSSSTINDLFGIKMDMQDTALFNIESYSEADGIKFQNSPLMEPKIFAWAEFANETITLLITNNTPKAISSSYNSDNFYLITHDGKEYVLIKGEAYKYPNSGYLNPNKTIQLTLELPRSYWDHLGTRKFELLDEEPIKEFQKGVDEIALNKAKTKYIKAVLGGTIYIILKPVPAS